MEFQSIRIAGLKLRWTARRRERAPTVLLLSPLPQSVMAYAPVWERLAAQLDVVALDLPGFGGSEGGPEIMDIFRQAELLQQFIDAVGLREPHLVGPDVGTPVALAYLQRSRNAASAVVGDGPAVYPAYMGPAITRMMRSSMWRRFYGLSSSLFIREGNRVGYKRYRPTPVELQDYERSYKGRLGGVMAWFSRYDEALPRLDQGLAAIAVPVKIFWGELDEIVLPRTAQALHERLPRSEVQIFRGAGHFSYQDAADEFAQMLLDWAGGGYQRL